jgi:hypothetical protein
MTQNTGSDAPLTQMATLEILVHPDRNAKAAKRFLKRLIAQFGAPRVVVTDKLRSYTRPIKALVPNADHRLHKGPNNRIELSHQPARKREKLMGRFKSPRQTQKFHAAHDQISKVFRPSPLPKFYHLIPPFQIRCFPIVDRLRARNDRLIVAYITSCHPRETTWQCLPLLIYAN